MLHYEEENDMNRLLGLLAARKHAKKQAKQPSALTFPLFSSIAGTSFDDRQKYLKKSRVGDKLFISHNPLPHYGESAVIISVRTKKVLGHVQSPLATTILSSFGAGWTANGEITELTGGTTQKPNRGCNYRINEIKSE